MSAGKCSISADFLEHQGKKLFYLLLRPSEVEARGSVLFLPPFTEEMHKSRHIVASQARAIAARGYNVLLFDLSGCGDSGGDFADATWQVWLQDATVAADTLMSLGGGPLNQISLALAQPLIYTWHSIDVALLHTGSWRVLRSSSAYSRCSEAFGGPLRCLWNAHRVLGGP